jgi:YjjG family noncanonical pyrimidine nucleotidase
MRNELDWILFDADHTLFDFDRSARISLQGTLDKYGIAHTEETLEDYFVINRACWREYEEGKIDRGTLTRRRFELFFEKIGIDGVDPLMFHATYMSQLPEHPYFLEGAPGVLDVVGQFFRMGIITNGLQEVQRPRLLKSGIAHLFELIVVSGEIGLVKPDPAYFAYAHREMKMPEKDRVLVVGDSLYSDMHGGMTYGFRTCWYNPSGSPATEDIQPDYEVRSHAELIELVIGEMD